MIKHRKITSFLLSLLVCAAAAGTPAMYSFADNEEDTTVSAEAEDSDIRSGAFGYVLLDDGTAKLTLCELTDEVIEVPETLDGIAVTAVSRSAFIDAADTVKRIVLPAGITEIDEDTPFVYLSSLEEIDVADDNSSYVSVDGVLFTKDMSSLICYPRAKTGDEYSVPEGVKTIAYAAMSGAQLKKVTMPSSLTSLGSMSLSYCDSLVSADMSGSSVTEIVSEAFEGCTSLTEVLLPDTLTEIGGGAFWNCSSLTKIDLPEGLQTIEQYAFAGAPIKRIYIPSSVSYIGYYALGYISDTETVEDFTLVGEPGTYAQVYATETDEEYNYANNFNYMTPDEADVLDEYESFDLITSGDFQYTKIDGGVMIVSCTSAESALTVPSEIDGLPVIRLYFASFSTASCADITVPASVKTIDNMAFYNSSMLRILTIEGAETIGEGCFEGCTLLNTVNISSVCRSIEGAEPFSGCTSLTAINITGSGGEYTSENGVLYNKDMTTLIAYPAAKADKKFKAPDSVKQIAQSAFYGVEYLETADLSGVETISPYAFEGSAALKEVKLSKDLKTVGQYAFLDCPALMGVRLYDKLETIGDYAFGFHYDSSVDTSEDENACYVVTEGFKIYAEENTLGYKYAQANGVEVVSGTVPFLGYNMDKTFLMVLGGLAGTAAVAGTGVAVRKSVLSKREEREKEEARAKAVARRAAKKENNDEN